MFIVLIILSLLIEAVAVVLLGNIIVNFILFSVISSIEISAIDIQGYINSCIVFFSRSSSLFPIILVVRPNKSSVDTLSKSAILHSVSYFGSRP